jgi:hypothetical protein
MDTRSYEEIPLTEITFNPNDIRDDDTGADSHASLTMTRMSHALSKFHKGHFPSANTNFSIQGLSPYLHRMLTSLIVNLFAEL